MNKNTILAIVLSIVVVILGVGAQYLFFPSKSDSSQKTVSSTSDIEILEIVENNKDDTQSVILEDTDEKIEEQIITIKSDLYEVTLSNKGGDVISYNLLQDNGEKVEMAGGITDKERAFSVMFGDAKQGILIDDMMNVKVFDDYTIGYFKDLKLVNKNGEVKTYSFGKKYSFIPDNYMFELTVSIEGKDKDEGINLNGCAYTIITSPTIGPEYDSSDRYEFRRFYGYVNGKEKKYNLSSNKFDTKIDPMTWTAVAGKYFSIVAIPKIPFSSVSYSTMPNSKGQIQSKMYLSREPMESEKTTDTYRFFIGPKQEKVLVSYNSPESNPYKLNSVRIDEVIEGSNFWGWLETILKWIMELFYKLIPNWGVAIIFTTILVKALFFPLTRKSTMSTIKMQKLQPALQELQVKYKNNPEKLNQEMMAMYQKAGANPMSGCLPLLIQFPILIAMYNLFNNHFELRGQPFIYGWISDLSKGDSVYHFKSSIDFFFIHLSDIRILPFVYLASQLIFGKITQTPNANQTNGTAKFMMFGMPILFFFIFYNAPAGLLLYWTVSNLLQMVQQKIIYASMNKENKAVAEKK